MHILIQILAMLSCMSGLFQPRHPSAWGAWADIRVFSGLKACEGGTLAAWMLVGVSSLNIHIPGATGPVIWAHYPFTAYNHREDKVFLSLVQKEGNWISERSSNLLQAPVSKCVWFQTYECLTPKLIIILLQARVEVVVHLSRRAASMLFCSHLFSWTTAGGVSLEEWCIRRPLGLLPAFWEVMNPVLQPQVKLSAHERDFFVPRFASSFI